MEGEYTAEVAKHYHAYRPPLHEEILVRAFGANTVFEKGLDVGCGTGQSAIALTKYCSAVVGVEPSRDMLEQALSHPKVEYLHYNGTKLPFRDSSFEVITFAGSLFYAKSQQLLDEVVRISEDNSTIIVYDFQILFDGLHPHILPQITESDYDHEADFSGLNLNGLNKLNSFTKDTTLNISAADIAHLLLSNKGQYLSFKVKYQTSDPYSLLVEDLEEISNDKDHVYPVKLYCTIYHHNRK